MSLNDLRRVANAIGLNVAKLPSLPDPRPDVEYLNPPHLIGPTRRFEGIYQDANGRRWHMVSDPHAISQTEQKE